MSLTDGHKKILEEIVNLDGDCLKSERCERCPFQFQCLPEFLSSAKAPPTKNQRFQMALDSITQDIILEDQEPNTWKK